MLSLLSTINLLLHLTKEQSCLPLISFFFFINLSPSSAYLPRCSAKPFLFFVFSKHECFEP
jgi:hypothetical protein